MALEEHITPQRIASSIMLNAQSYDSFMIVEGKTDYSLFKKFIRKKSTKIEIAFGHEKVVEVIHELRKRGFNGAIGIIDSDFCQLDDNMIEDDDIVHTDYHDIEIMVINSESFDIVLDNYVQKNKLKTHYETLNSFRQHLFAITKHLGYLKWLNKTNGLGLVFKPTLPEGKPLDYSKFISIDSLLFLGNEALIDSVLNYCVGKVKIGITKADLKKQLERFIKECDLNHLCNGHDIMHVISLSLRKNISNLNASAIKANQLSKEMILAYEARYFINTSLYRDIKSWEKNRKLAILDI